jgi:hypothetical protein
MKTNLFYRGATYAGLFVAGIAVHGQLLTSETYQFTGGSLPMSATDGGTVPVSDTRIILSNIGEIRDVNVSFTLTNPNPGGAFNGDFYASLTHSSGFAVLLNRVGVRSGSTPDEMAGYGDNGFSVTLDDQAANGDIHTYRMQLPLVPGGLAGGSHGTPVDPAYVLPLTGTWAPDGRNVSADSVTIESPRTAMLSSFNGLPASGSWVFTFADLSPGGTAQLSSWSIEVTGVAVPEPAETAAIAAGALVAAAVLLKRRFRA